MSFNLGDLCCGKPLYRKDTGAKWIFTHVQPREGKPCPYFVKPDGADGLGKVEFTLDQLNELFRLEVTDG